MTISTKSTVMKDFSFLQRNDNYCLCIYINIYKCNIYTFTKHIAI